MSNLQRRILMKRLALYPFYLMANLRRGGRVILLKLVVQLRARFRKIRPRFETL